jgi:thioredoxin-like negative regulator of GroEL
MPGRDDRSTPPRRAPKPPGRTPPGRTPPGRTPPGRTPAGKKSVARKPAARTAGNPRAKAGARPDRGGGRPAPPPEQGPTTWGGVARRGAGRLKAEDDATAAAIWRKTVETARRRDDDGPPRRPPQPKRDAEIVEVREVAADAVGRATTKRRQRTPAGSARPRRSARPPGAPPALDRSAMRDQLSRQVGPSQAPKLAQRLAEAGRAFSRERYADASHLLGPLAKQAPGAPAVRELYGLTLYRLGRWRDAARELEQFRLLTGSTEQHPVLADSYRALGHYTEVDELWRELREVSPSAPLVAEGRIVMAGSLADQDRLADAIRVLEQGVKFPKRPQDHHVRMWYALADLYERAGDIVRSRELFKRVVGADPDFVDAATRLRSLR